MHGWGYFFLFLFLLIIFGAVGWVGFTQYRARKAGLPPPAWRSYIPFIKGGSTSNYPAPRSSGPLDWIKDKIAALRNTRSARGAYEEPLEAGAGHRPSARRGRGLDPDDAWDARVVNEADAYGPGGYYEEQELGLQTPGVDQYGGSGYGGSAALPQYGEGERGRSKSRDAPTSIAGGQAGLDDRFDEEMGRKPPTENPFGDQHEATSLRDVSPRPHLDTTQGQRLGHTKGQESHDDSPTERKSMFREGL